MPNALGNLFVKAIAGSPLHPLLGSGIAVITVRGRKSGKPITTPINVVAGGDGFTATSLRTRTWWRNLRGGVPADLRVAGCQRRVNGEVVEDPALVAAGFARYFAEHPNLARFFGAALGPDGRPSRESLERLAQERVMIHLRPLPDA